MATVSKKQVEATVKTLPVQTTVKKPPVETTVSQEQINAIGYSYHRDPFEVLGMHAAQFKGRQVIAVRAYFYDVRESFVYVPAEDKLYPMTRMPDTGFFEAIFADRAATFPYQLETIDDQGKRTRFHDVYSFWPVMSEDDLYLMGEGKHYKIYEKLGCHLITHQGVAGAMFAVWAPNAKRVSVVGNFNQWDGRRHPMRMRGASGVWELFVPGLPEGELYKYEIKTQLDHLYVKTDPYAFFCEKRPNTSSIIARLDHFSWNDQDWLYQRAHENPLEKPISIYEVHLGSWMRVSEEENRFLTYRELAERLIPYVKDLGFTHLELLPIAEHPLDTSWGYQVANYYAVTSRYGKPEDFMYFVNECHRQGLGVLVDWVPAHFPRDSHSLAYFDGTCLYEHADPRKGEHKDWGTLIFNYGRNEVRNFLVGNALFWFEKYHIDGIRVDAVASMLYLDYSRKEGEWLPNKYGGRENLEAIDFLRELNEAIFREYPGALSIAEESTSWPAVSHPTYLGGLGFNLKWNMGWMNDMLSYMSKEPVHRKYHQNMITFALLYAFHENFVLVLSHDEVVHGKRSLLDKMPGDLWQKFANLRAFYGFMLGHPGKKLLFMGAELGQWNEWNCDSSQDWHLLDYDNHRQLKQYLRDLNHLYSAEPALHKADFDYRGFEWIDFRDADRSIIAFLRRSVEGKHPIIVFVCNFTPVPWQDYRIGVPFPGYYKEVLNSDSTYYGGSNVGNEGGGCMAEPTPWQGHQYSLDLTIPPLCTLILKPEYVG